MGYTYAYIANKNVHATSTDDVSSQLHKVLQLENVLYGKSERRDVNLLREGPRN